MRAAVHADDASRLLTALRREPAYVFGSSGGAMVGLVLVVQHPEQVRTLIAHEPPLTELLPDRDRYRAVWQDIHKTFRREGAGPAMARFLASAGFNRNGRQPAPAPGNDVNPEAQAAMARLARDIELFVAHAGGELFVPDLAALRSGTPRIVVAGGEESHGQPAYAAAAALAERLCMPVEEVPGDHGGLVAQPTAFAERRHAVLSGK